MGASCQNIVYGLSDPRTGCLMYIGKSTRGLKRPRAHLRPSVLKRERCRKRHWVVGLQNLGLLPGIEVLEEVATAEELPEAERFWIASVRATGAKLLNDTDGGEGTLGRPVTAAQREFSRKINLGNKHAQGCKRSPEFVENMRKRGIGKRLSDETKKKISVQVKSRVFSSEELARRKDHARALGKANAGRRHSDFARAKMSEKQSKRVSNSEGVVVDSFGNRFNSLTAAEKHHGINRHKIVKACKGLILHANGMSFRFEKDPS